jgi:ABC-type phosphate/phosphonate transport system substrate-binding protein
MEVKFQVISETDPVPHILFAAHPRVSSANKKHLTEALLGWSQTPEGKKMLQNKWLMPFRRISDQDFDLVRKIKKEVDNY